MSYRTKFLEGSTVVDIRESESHDNDAGTFNYYGFIYPNGQWAIMREDSAGEQYRFAWGNNQKDYETYFGNRQSLGYRLPVTSS